MIYTVKLSSKGRIEIIVALRLRIILVISHMIYKPEMRSWVLDGLAEALDKVTHSQFYC